MVALFSLGWYETEDVTHTRRVQHRACIQQTLIELTVATFFSQITGRWVFSELLGMERAGR